MSQGENFDQIAGVVGFIANNSIRPVTENFMTDLGKWYFRVCHSLCLTLPYPLHQIMPSSHSHAASSQNSLILVQGDHLVWEPDRKKPSRRFGRLVQSPHNGLENMLTQHMAEVKGFVLKQAGKAVEENEEPDGDTIMVISDKRR
jgi:histone deacetylase 6